MFKVYLQTHCLKQLKQNHCKDFHNTVMLDPNPWLALSPEISIKFKEWFWKRKKKCNATRNPE